MLINSIEVNIQRQGLLLGQRQLLVKFPLSNTHSPYNDVPVEGEEYTAEEFISAIKEKNNKYLAMLALTGGEPLLQVDYFKHVLAKLPLPIFLQSNGTLPQALAEVKDHCSLIEIELIPAYQSEFIQSLELLSSTEYYVRLVVTKETTPKQVEDLAKIITSFKPNTIFVLEPLFGVKNYLALQAMAQRQLSDVRIIPRVHL